MIAKCHCHGCGQPIEYEIEHGGESVACPGCAKPVTLPAPLHSFSLKRPPELEPKRKPTTHFLDVFSVIMFFVGCGLVFSGCVGEFDESMRESGSAIRQVVYVTQYGFGFVLMAATFILRALTRIIKSK